MANGMYRIGTVAFESDIALHLQSTGRRLSLPSIGLFEPCVPALAGSITSQGKWTPPFWLHAFLLTKASSALVPLGLPVHVRNGSPWDAWSVWTFRSP